MTKRKLQNFNGNWEAERSEKTGNINLFAGRWSGTRRDGDYLVCSLVQGAHGELTEAADFIVKACNFYAQHLKG